MHGTGSRAMWFERVVPERVKSGDEGRPLSGRGCMLDADNIRAWQDMQQYGSGLIQG